MEKLLQHIWQHRLWMPEKLETVSGETVEVLDPGLLNHDAGPDFFNAKLRIDGRTWAGNVEVHVRASDWKRHGHDSDPAYGTVILHVVGSDDARITRDDGSEIPQLVLHCAERYKELLDKLMDRPEYELACFRQLENVPQIYRTDWLTALAFERIHSKTERLIETMQRTDGQWRAAFFVTLARGLGFGINGEPFERLALATPLNVLLRHQGDCHVIESILFGQATLLNGAETAGMLETEYLNSLRRDYDFFRQKYHLQQPSGLAWKMARMRPQNFPHRRIAWLAAVLAQGFNIAADLASVKDIDSARELFSTELNTFWASHFSFAPTTASSSNPCLSRSAIDILIINVIVPAMQAYATLYGNKENLRECSQILQSLPPEDNRIVRLFRSAGIDCPDAFTSQALVQLRRAYCEPRKCLYCRFGMRFLTAAARK